MEKKVFLHSALFKYAQINSDAVGLDLVMLPSYVVTILVLKHHLEKKQCGCQEKVSCTGLLPAKSPALFVLFRIGGEFLPWCQHFLITLAALLQLELR